MSELKPCPFCGEDRDRIMEAFMDGFAKIIEADGHYALSVEDNDATTSLIFNINNCPICGRPLDLRAQPANDPLTHCRDCTKAEPFQGNYICSEYGGIWGENDGCTHGERPPERSENDG